MNRRPALRSMIHLFHTEPDKPAVAAVIGTTAGAPTLEAYNRTARGPLPYPFLPAEEAEAVRLVRAWLADGAAVGVFCNPWCAAEAERWLRAAYAEGRRHG